MAEDVVFRILVGVDHSEPTHACGSQRVHHNRTDCASPDNSNILLEQIEGRAATLTHVARRVAARYQRRDGCIPVHDTTVAGEGHADQRPAASLARN